MVAFIENTKKATRESLKYLFMDFLQLSSNRVKFCWSSFAAWMFGITWFGMVVPFVREVSIIFYRQNGFQNAAPINLDSVYGSTILTLLGTAFGLTVGAYVASRMPNYKNQSSDMGADGKNKNDSENESIQADTALDVDKTK